jgi:lipopolysaccharide transport system permease protein
MPAQPEFPLPTGLKCPDSLAFMLNAVLNQILPRLPLPQGIRFKLDLLKTLVQRDLAARYKGSILGNAWSLVNQLVQLLVYTYVFSVVLKVRLELKGMDSAITGNTLFFGLWLFAGLIPWIAFTTGFGQATASVFNQANLVKKVVFPLTLLPLVPILTAFVDSLLGFVLLIVGVGLIVGRVNAALLFMPLIWLPQLLFTAGVSYLMAGFAVFVRDIPQTVGIGLNLLFYLTPVMYPLERIPEPFFSIAWYNPFSAIITLYRDCVLQGSITHWAELGYLWVVALVMFALGSLVYRRLSPAFADVL